MAEISASDRSRIAATIEQLARPRAAKSGTICPSEVARALWKSEQEWRAKMGAVRAVAADMSDKVIFTQKGEQVAPDAKGPVRLKWIEQ